MRVSVVVLISILAAFALAKSDKHAKHYESHVADEVDSDNEVNSFEEEDNNDDNSYAAEHDDEADSADRALEEKQQAEEKVENDITRMTQQLEESDMSSETIEMAKRNLQAIKKDAKEIVGATASRASNLKQAINKRMQALKMLLEESDSNNNNAEADEDDQADEEEKRNDKGVAHQRVMDDIAKINRQLEESSDLSDETVEMAKSNVAMISKDIKLLETSTGSRAGALKEAVKLRIQALKQMLQEQPATAARDQEEEEEESAEEEKENVNENAEKIDVIHSDITKLEEAMSSAHLSAKVQRSVQKNLEAIESDAKRVQEASTATQKSNLKEAMKLRMKALRQQLEEQGEETHVAKKVKAHKKHHTGLW
eukprot:c5263_g1_i1.p1 GENE.c5263_g1_i1~~c5263_g1_i1.p1  ORF type:complete len:369 (-),score=143.82 c5263_g1_i1:72-1178(-)